MTKEDVINALYKEYAKGYRDGWKDGEGGWEYVESNKQLYEAYCRWCNDNWKEIEKNYFKKPKFK